VSYCRDCNVFEFLLMCDLLLNLKATAAVDAETDQKLQLIMKKEFHNSTCITIAHRLNTIMDSDLILCMDDGKSAQFGRPADLLKAGGLFKDLVDAWEEDESN